MKAAKPKRSVSRQTPLMAVPIQQPVGKAQVRPYKAILHKLGKPKLLAGTAPAKVTARRPQAWRLRLVVAAVNADGGRPFLVGAPPPIKKAAVQRRRLGKPLQPRPTPPNSLVVSRRHVGERAAAKLAVGAGRVGRAILA